jgi:hypothetical protein
MPKSNRTTLQDRNRKMAAATQKYLANLVHIFVAGVAYTPPQIVKILMDDTNAADAATTAKAQFHDAVVAARAQRALLRPFMPGFRSFVLNQFKDEGIIAEFGFSRKQTTRKVADKAAAATKAKATRTARHTMGKVQRKNVKGTTPATTAAAGPATSPANKQPVVP